MESSVSFIIGTERQEFIVSGGGQTISKKNVSVRPHTSHGSAPLLSVSSDNVVFYVGKTREQLFLFKYNEANGSYISQEISMLNDDVFKKKIKRLVWHEELGLLMVLLDTAELVTITFNNESGTLALTEHEFSFPIKDISYGIGESEDDYAVLLTQKDGRDFIEVLDRRELGYISSVLQSEDIHKKIPHGDSVQALEPFGTEFPTFLSATEDIMEVDASKYVVGQEVVFTSSDPNILLGTGLSLSTFYYAIPVSSGGVSGIRLALSAADAATNTYINIPGLDQYFTVTPLRMDTNRLPLTTIPVLSYAEGDQVQIFHDNGGVVNSVTYTKVSGETEFDLGVTPDASVVSAVAFKMTMATMPVEAGQQWGTAQLALKRIDNLLVRFYESYSFKFSTDGYNEEEVVYNEITTGRVERALTASSEYDQRVFVTNDKIEPCYISNLSMRGVSNDG